MYESADFSCGVIYRHTDTGAKSGIELSGARATFIIAISTAFPFIYTYPNDSSILSHEALSGIRKTSPIIRSFSLHSSD